MTCRDRDQDILLMVHGELSFWRQIALKTHLWRCARCQATQQQYAAASHALAKALRGPELPPWSLTRTPALVRNAPRLDLWQQVIIGTLIFLLFTVAFVKATITVRAHRPAPSVTNSNSSGCQPGLPNDRCR